MDLPQCLGPRHQKHNRERVCFADFGRHRVDSLCLRRVMRYEAVMAA